MRPQVILALSLLSVAPDVPAAPAPASPPAAAQSPLQNLPYTPSLDVTAMDRSANACADFYQYSCGGWLARNPIPADQASWSVYGKLYEDNQRFLWGILDSLARNSAGRSANQQKIGDYFASCMDETAIEQRGRTPLAPTLAAIDAMTSARELPALLARLQLDNGGDEFLFGLTSAQDFADSKAVIAFANAGGLGMPDRDYYTDSDKRALTLRQEYRRHVARSFALLGDSAAAAAQHADTVLRLETQLAQASLTRVELRDPYNLFHKMDRAGLEHLTPHFVWDPFLNALGLSGVNTLNVRNRSSTPHSISYSRPPHSTI